MIKTVVISGASNGIGRALALAYAKPDVNLGLMGRDAGRLEAIAGECRALGADVETAAIDVLDRAKMASWLQQFDAAKTVDLVVAAAGVLSGLAPGRTTEDADQARALIETNVVGVMNTVQPLLPAMVCRRSGQIAIVSSIAGLAPLAYMPSYSASKAALISYGLALRAGLRPQNVRVSVICPGYVATPMTAQVSGAKPMMITAEKAAEKIVRGLARDKAVIAFPLVLAWLTRFAALMPDALRRRLLPSSYSIAPRL